MYRIIFYIYLIFFSFIFSFQKESNTESWYFYFGSGPSTFSEALDTIPGLANSRAYDMGFYWHKNLQTIIGLGLTGKSESIKNKNLELEKEYDVVLGPSLNLIHFKDNFGKGVFYRLGVGFSQAQFSIQEFGEKIFEGPEDRGIGFILGSGYSLEYKQKSRYMLGLYLGASMFEEKIETYVNLVFNGLW